MKSGDKHPKNEMLTRNEKRTKINTENVTKQTESSWNETLIQNQPKRDKRLISIFILLDERMSSQSPVDSPVDFYAALVSFSYTFDKLEANSTSCLLFNRKWMKGKLQKSLEKRD